MSEYREIVASLARMHLARADEKPAVETLSGGVSGDVFLVRFADRALCVKRALAKLRVKEDWRAPVERAHIEVQWLRFAAGVDPHLVPAVLGEDEPGHLFAMAYLEPATHPWWKTMLLQGIVEPDFAGRVGAALARIHGASAGRADVASAFATGELFHALRIEPYLLFTAGRHPDRAERIRAIANDIARARIALMHGDVSPKNILKGPGGPIFLDAETACYGDPCFDIAFCLNHLLLKGTNRPQDRAKLAQSFVQFHEAYFARVDWEDASALDRRSAGLLGALLLARIDGKSPVEYLTREAQKEFVRKAARDYLAKDDMTLTDMISDWTKRLAA